MVDRPIFDEIVTIDQGRDITRPWISPLLLTQDSLLETKGHFDLKIYEEVLRDEQVHACYQQRFKSLTACEWEVKAGGDKRLDQKAADFVREQLTQIAWDDITEKHLYALHYGYSVAECLWMRDGQYVSFDDTRDGIRVRNRRRFRFDPELGLRLITWGDQMVGEVMPDRKFWNFCVGADHHDDPYGKGLGHWLYWLTYFKRNDMKVWLRFLEKFSMPTVAVEYPQGMPKDEQDKLLKAAYAVMNAAAVKVPQGAGLSFLEASRSGTADYQALWDTCNAGISKVILSQTMTTDNGSSLSQAQVHEGVAQRVVKSDADLICSSFNRSVVRWLTDWNFPGAAYPVVWRKTEAEADLKSQVERDKILFDMGFVPSGAYVQETYGDGFALPGDDSPTGLNGTQLDSILSIVDAIQSGTLTTEVGQELIALAVPSVSADIALRIATPPEPTTPEAAAAPASIDEIATQFAEGGLEFAAKGKGRKKGKGPKNCEKGINCGGTCISAKKVCRKELSPQAAAKTKAVKPKVPKGGGGGGGEASNAPAVADQVLGGVTPAVNPVKPDLSKPEQLAKLEAEAAAMDKLAKKKGAEKKTALTADPAKLTTVAVDPAVYGGKTTAQAFAGSPSIPQEGGNSRIFMARELVAKTGDADAHDMVNHLAQMKSVYGDSPAFKDKPKLDSDFFVKQSSADLQAIWAKSSDSAKANWAKEYGDTLSPSKNPVVQKISQDLVDRRKAQVEAEEIARRAAKKAAKAAKAVAVDPATLAIFERIEKNHDTSAGKKLTSDLTKLLGEQNVKLIEGKAKELLADSDAHIRVSPTSLNAILKSGGFKNFAEFDSLKGKDYDNIRKDSELRTMGIPIDSLPNERPIYGYFAKKSHGIEAEATDGYGSIAVRMKRSVRERATFSGDDNFAGNTPSTPNNPRIASLVPRTFAKELIRESDDSPKKKAGIEQIKETGKSKDMADFLDNSLGQYFEAQIHGGVKTSDFDAIIYPKGLLPPKNIIDWAKANNVSIESSEV